MKTEKLLVDVAIQAQSLDISKRAVEGIKDQSQLLNVGLNTKSFDLLNVILGRCDQNGIVQIASKHPNLKMRQKAIECITDQKIKNELNEQIAAAKKQSSVAAAYILANVNKPVRRVNGGRYVNDEAGYQALTQQLKGQLAQVTEVSDLEKIAKLCETWRDWKDSDHDYKVNRGRIFVEEYLPMQYAMACKTPEEVATFINGKYWIGTPKPAVVSTMIPKIKDPQQLLALANSGCAEAYRYMSDDAFVSFAIALDRKGNFTTNLDMADPQPQKIRRGRRGKDSGGFEAMTLPKRIKSLPDPLLAKLVAKAKRGDIRDLALTCIKSDDAIIAACKEFNDDYDQRPSVTGDLLKRVSKDKIIDVYKANPVFYNTLGNSMVIADEKMALFMLENIDWKNLGWYKSRQIIALLSKPKKDEYLKKARAKAASKAKDNFVANGMFVGMHVFDYALLLDEKGVLDPKVEPDTTLEGQLKKLHFNQKCRYKLLEVDDGEAAFKQFVAKCLNNKVDRNKFSTNIENRWNKLGSYKMATVWYYKDAKLDAEVLMDEFGTLEIKSLGVR